MNATHKNSKPLSSEEDRKDDENLEAISNSQQKNLPMKEIPTEVDFPVLPIPSIITTRETIM